MLKARRVVVGTAPVFLFAGLESPPPNRWTGRTSVLIRNMGPAGIFLGGADVNTSDQGFVLRASETISLAPIGPGDEVWAISADADNQVEYIIQDAYIS